MHVGLVCYEYPPFLHGGVGTLYRDLAEGLVENGHQVTVVGVYESWLTEMQEATYDVQNGVNIYRLPPSRRLPTRVGFLWDRWRLTWWLKHYHKRHPLDLIECPESKGWLFFGGPAGVPTVVRFTGAQIFFDYELQRPGSRLVHIAEKRWIRHADFITSISDHAARLTLKLTGLSDRPYSVIHNAVDVARFSPDLERSNEDGLIVFANSIIPKKGVVQLVEAMTTVCESYPTAHLVLVGKNRTTMASGQTLSDFALSHVPPAIRERISFTGWLPNLQDVVDYLQRASVCCYPSHAEGLGIAPIEAMAVGKPTIFMRDAPGPEVIEHGVNGLLCDSRTPKDIAHQILAILNNPELARKLGQNARQRVLERFDKSKWIRKNLEFYDECRKNYHT